MSTEANSLQAAVATNGGGDGLVEVRDLVKHFPISKGVIFQKQVGAVRAVDGISFDVKRGEALGIVGAIIGEPFVIHNLNKGEGKRKKAVQELMEQVGLNPEHYNRYPHEFSGGQRQRIGVARALALQPKLIIADEPVSALDVSIQAQILNLLADLQRELGLTIIFIAHDLSVVRHMCDRIAVMYLGKIVELAEADDLYQHPRHPYTGALLSAVPVPDPRLARERDRVVR